MNVVLARRIAGCLLVAVVVWMVHVQSAAMVGEELLALFFLLMTCVGVTTLSWMLHAWRSDGSLEDASFPPTNGGDPQLSFSLIVPARHEEAVLAATIAQLQLQDHPSFEVVIVVADDDPDTAAVAREAIADDPRFRVLVTTTQRNKAMALNFALARCRGDVVGVFDAEDIVAPRLLRSVDQRFQESGAEIVQGATQLMNFQSNWFSVRNVLEYYFWFRSKLQFHARAGFIPLGGNTVFVRRDWLVAADGWDETCLVEDCELGTRLSSRGARTVVAYSPDLVTREETPENVVALVRQRTRWNQGYLQVYRKGDWRSLPLRARLLAAYTLAFPFLQAVMGLSVPIALVAIFVLRLPIELALLSFLPVLPLAAILAVELVGLHCFAEDFGMHARVRDYARLVIGVFPYQVLLGFAAARAVWRQLRGVDNWEKTAHVGAHL